MKRMKDRSWIAVSGVGGRPVDYISSLVVDKLGQHGIANMRIVDTFCPAANNDGPQQGVIPPEGLGAESVDQHGLYNPQYCSEIGPAETTPEYVSLLNGRPFWW